MPDENTRSLVTFDSENFERAREILAGVVPSLGLDNVLGALAFIIDLSDAEDVRNHYYNALMEQGVVVLVGLGQSLRDWQDELVESGLSSGPSNNNK